MPLLKSQQQFHLVHRARENSLGQFDITLHSLFDNCKVVDKQRRRFMS